jgi:hypothetical protein
VLGFEFGEEALDFGVTVEARQAVPGIFVEEFHFGAGDGFGAVYAVLQAIEGGASRVIANCGLRPGGFAEGYASALARQNEVALGFGFVEFLFELDESVFQSFYLQLLVADLFAVTERKFL